MRRAFTLVGIAAAAVLAGAGTAWAQDGGSGVAGWLQENAGAVWDEFWKGGTTMWFLLLLSVAGLAVTLERALRLRGSRIVPQGLAAECMSLWNQGRYDEITAKCERSGSSLGRAIEAIVLHRDAAIQDVRMIAGDVGTREMRPHYRRVLWLAVVATISPLLGLFGTVIGMMGAFQNFKMLGETGDPTVFAGDISKALVTTATGLIIAMPCLFLYYWFKGRTNALADEMEGQLSELTVAWFVESKTAAEARAARGDA